MTRIHVLGGTGFAGDAIVREAAARGHRVTSYSRSIPDKPADGVIYQTGDLLNAAALRAAFDNVDVVVVALSAYAPPFSEATTFRDLIRRAAALASERGVRLGVIGGAGSLLTAPDGPRLVDTNDWPAHARPFALVLADLLEELRGIDDERLDWFYLTPPPGYGRRNPGRSTGLYRIGGDVAPVDADGRSALSRADLALALVDEIEAPVHRRQRFSVAY